MHMGPRVRLSFGTGMRCRRSFVTRRTIGYLGVSKAKNINRHRFLSNQGRAPGQVTTHAEAHHARRHLMVMPSCRSPPPLATRLAPSPPSYRPWHPPASRAASDLCISGGYGFRLSSNGLPCLRRRTRGIYARRSANSTHRGVPSVLGRRVPTDHPQASAVRALYDR